MPRRVVRSHPISVRVRPRDRFPDDDRQPDDHRLDDDGFDERLPSLSDDDTFGRGHDDDEGLGGSGSLRRRIDSFRDEDVDRGDGLSGGLGGSLGSRINNFGDARGDGLAGMGNEFGGQDDRVDGSRESLAERIDAQKRNDFSSAREGEAGHDADDAASDLVDCGLDDDEEGV